jgi:hypothetical protein
MRGSLRMSGEAKCPGAGHPTSRSMRCGFAGRQPHPNPSQQEPEGPGAPFMPRTLRHEWESKNNRAPGAPLMRGFLRMSGEATIRVPHVSLLRHGFAGCQPHPNPRTSKTRKGTTSVVPSTQATRPFHSAEGRREGEAATTKLPSFKQPQNPVKPPTHPTHSFQTK